MGVIKLRSVPIAPKDNDMWSSRRVGYLGDKEKEPADMWPTNSYGEQDRRMSYPQQDTDYRRSNMHYPPDRERMMMRMRELDEERSHLEQSMKQMENESMPQDMNPKLVDKIEELVSEAAAVAMDPPDTWKQYLDKKDMAGVITMESKELHEVLGKGKNPKDVHKEIVHVMAALLRAAI